YDERVWIIDEETYEIEDYAREPRSDRNGHEHRMNRVPIGAAYWGARAFRSRHFVGIGFDRIRTTHPDLHLLDADRAQGSTLTLRWLSVGRGVVGRRGA